MEFLLSRKTLILWQLRAALFFAVVSVAFLLFGTMKWAQIVSTVMAVTGVVTVFIYIPLLFKGWRMEIDRNTVTVEWGVIIKIIHIMPFARLIYISSYSLPLGSLLGLSGLVLKGARARLFLPELEKEKVKLVLELMGRGEQQ